MKPFNGAVSTIQKICRFADVYFITTRDNYGEAQMKHDVGIWLHSIGIKKYKGIIFEKYKEKMIKKLNINLFIEDSVRSAQRIARKGIPVILINRPWNAHLDGKLFWKADSWENVLPIISEHLLKGKNYVV